MKRTPLKRTGRLKRKTPMKRSRMKRRVKSEDRAAAKWRAKWRAEKPHCMVCMFRWVNPVPILGTEIHHMATRGRGKYAPPRDDPRFWLVVCRSCHDELTARSPMTDLLAVDAKRFCDPANYDFAALVDADYRFKRIAGEVPK